MRRQYPTRLCLAPRGILRFHERALPPAATRSREQAGMCVVCQNYKGFGVRGIAPAEAVPSGGADAESACP
jgi:hypothetical protein